MLMVIEEIKLMGVAFDRPRFSARLICMSSSKANPSNLEGSGMVSQSLEVPQLRNV